MSVAMSKVPVKIWKPVCLVCPLPTNGYCEIVLSLSDAQIEPSQAISVFDFFEIVQN